MLRIFRKQVLLIDFIAYRNNREIVDQILTGKTDSQAAFDALERAMLRVFPDLRGVPITHRWSGLVAMTLDAVPQLGRLDDRISFALGYNGAGIAMASLMGRYAADVTLGDRPDLALLRPKSR